MRDAVISGGRMEIKVALTRHGWTQKDLAQAGGISPAFLSDVLKGRRRVNPKIAFACEAHLGMDAGLLLREEVEAYAERLHDELRLLRKESTP